MTDESQDPVVAEPSEAPKIVVFPPDDAEAIFTELGTLSVELDEDPLAFGPKRLNKKTAVVRRMLDRCERIFLDVSQRLYWTKRHLRVVETGLDMAKKRLFADDPETRAGGAVADREAIAQGKLSGEVRKMHDLEMLTADLDAVLVVVKSKRYDLKDTEGRLRDQIRLCQTELVVGHQWGSRVPPAETSVNLEEGRPAQSDAASIKEIIGMVDSEVHLAQDSGDWEDPVVVEEAPTSVVSPEEATPPEPEPVAEAAVVEPDPLVEVPPVGPTSLVDELLPETGVVASGEAILPPTVSAESAEMFLETLTMNDARKEPPPPPTGRMAIPEENLLDLLAEFEAP